MVVGGELKDSGTDREREIEWRNEKYTQQFHFETLKEWDTFGDLSQDEMLK